VSVEYAKLYKSLVVYSAPVYYPFNCLPTEISQPSLGLHSLGNHYQSLNKIAWRTHLSPSHYGWAGPQFPLIFVEKMLLFNRARIVNVNIAAALRGKRCKFFLALRNGYEPSLLTDQSITTIN